LVFAHAIDPYMGSEPGAGWAVVQAISEIADCKVIVDDIYAPQLREWKESNPSAPIEFFPVANSRTLKTIRSNHRILHFINYQRWLECAEVAARKMVAESHYDLAFHATYSAYWMPTPATNLGIPSIVGPIGGAVRTPVSMLRYLGLRGLLDEALDYLSVIASAARPQTRGTWEQADHLFIQNEETLQRMPEACREKSSLLNHATFLSFPAESRNAHGRDVLFCAGLESRKGPRLALRGFAACQSDTRLIVAGDGPAKADAMIYARKLGIEDRVDFIGRVPRTEIVRLLRQSAVALYTGLREEGGLALAEAMAIGTPVVVLAHGGAKTVAEASIDADRVALVPVGSPGETAQGIGCELDRFLRASFSSTEPNLDRDGAVAKLHDAIRRVVQRNSKNACASSMVAAFDDESPAVIRS